MELLHEVLNILNKVDVRIKIQKAQVCKSKIIFLDMHLDERGRKAAPKFVKTVTEAPRPSDRLTSWQRSFIPSYGRLTSCMQRLLKKDVMSIPWEML
eukprot:snap_masked-scaffold_39-processed-gene-2.17-mRNA-1 protein AED:1.00 eAED:1.00 QI:0/0/0/0/1/1/2/0/96